MSGFRTEQQLWDYMRGRLRGTWRRVETITPPGFPDALGVFGGEAFLLELKVGEPSRGALRPDQITFAEWIGEAIPTYVAFGSRNDKTIRFFRPPDFTKPVTPPFWVGGGLIPR